MPDRISPSTKRVLIFRLGSLGDTLVALPALRLIARAFPNAERRMLTTFPPKAIAAASSAILEHTGVVHGYVRYSYGLRDPQALLRLWWQITRWRPQVLVYLGGDKITLARAKRDQWFFRLCGIGRIVGVPEKLDQLRHRAVASADGKPLFESEAARLTRNLAELGDARIDEQASWDLNLTGDETAKAEAVLRPLQGKTLIAVSFGTKLMVKHWGDDNWTELLTRLAALPQEYALVLLGAADEAAETETAAASWTSGPAPRLLNLCGQLSPRESGAVLQRAALFIGHDSGPMHLAAAVGTPCVSLFTARDLPGLWFPHGAGNRVIYHHVECAGCQLTACIEQQKKCIRSITVDEVIGEVEKLLPSALPRSAAIVAF